MDNQERINMIESHIEDELQSYRDSVWQVSEDSFEHGILEGRKEFAQRVCDLINGEWV